MSATKTTWWDQNGDVHEGFIKDGKTYMDEAGTTRVPIGATVQTAGGTYKMTANGGVPTYATSRNQYEANASSAINAYEAAGKVQQDRIKRATDAAIAELNRQKQVSKTNMEDANRAATAAYLAAANPYGAMEEQRVRLGLDRSGYAESSKLRLASDYAAQLNENLRSMNEQLQSLDVQIAEAKASGKYELANMLEARAQNVMQQRIALQGNLYSGDMSATGQAESTRQFDESMAYQREQAAVAQQEAEKDKKWSLAMTFIENGKDASFIAKTLGISQADVNTLIAAVNAQRTVKASSVGGGKGGGTKVDAEYIGQIIADAGKKGLSIGDWIAEYGSAYKLTADEIRALVALEGGGLETLSAEVLDMAKGGASPDAIMEYIEANRGNLTDEKIAEIYENLDKTYPGWDA